MIDLATMNLSDYIRNIPDYPKPGIQFKDITPLLLVPEALDSAIRQMAVPFQSDPPDFVVGAEARGFLFGPGVALRLHAGFIPVRKPGKLPGETLRAEYSLEYGSDALEMHTNQIKPGSRVLVLDDLLATGGTIAAAAELIAKAGGEVIGFSFLIELAFLNGRKKLGSKKVTSVIKFDSE